MKTLLLTLLAVAPLMAADPPPAPAPAAKPAEHAPAFVGVQLDEVDDALAYHLELKNDLGVLVMAVSPGSPAEAMGLKPFDVIVGADGQPVYTPRAFTALVRGKNAGDTIQLQVRRGARTEELSGKLAARPAEADRPAGPARPRHMPFPGGPGGGPDGQRRGTVTQPDGSTMEWSIEDSPEPPALKAP